MRSTFKVLFYVNASKEKNGIVPIMGRVTINGSVAQFSCKRTIAKELWDVKGNRAKGKSKEEREINLALDNIKAQIIKHYQRLSDREAYVTAEMVRNAYQGIGTEYETLLGAFDKDNATFKKRVGIKPNTTLEDVRRFGEECQQRWGITPLQIFLHKDEGHWLSGEPAPDDKESFQIDGRWFKPNYHAHIVFDWMDHDTGKSRKLNDDDMMQMQTLASEILSMERGQSKTETGKEHLEHNDFIIEKQRAELERIEAERQHKEHQIDIAEQELKQVKSEIRTDKLKSVATDAATALASGVSSLFGSGKMKSLERKNEDLRDEIAIRDETIEQLQSNIKQMQAEHQKQIQEVKQSYEAEHRKQSEYIDKILRYFPYVEKLMPMIKYLSEKMGFNDNLIKLLCTFKEIPVKGKLYSTMFNQSFSADGAVCSLKEDKEGRFDLNIDAVSHHSWFRRKRDEFMEALGLPTSRSQNRGLKL